MNNKVTITITFKTNDSSAIFNICQFTKKYEDIMEIEDVSFERHWLSDISCVKLSGKEKETK